VGDLGVSEGIDFCGAASTGAPHMSQKLLPGDNCSPQFEQSNVSACGEGEGGCKVAGEFNAAPQLLQKASPGIMFAPQVEQVEITIAEESWIWVSGAGAAGRASLNAPPH